MKYTKMAILGAALFCLSVTAGAQTGDSDEEIKYIGDNSTVKMFKKVEKDASNPDQYLITLESFVTGTKEIHEVENHIPVDIALVLDMSGSMGRNISGSEYFPCTSEIEISYSQTKFPDYPQTCTWSDGHPRYFALFSTSSNSELFYKDDAGNYHSIVRKSSGGNPPSYGRELLGDSYYYIFYETDETFVDPFSGSTYKRRYFLGKDSDGSYKARYFGDTTYPIVLKAGAPLGSNNPDDYEVMTGFYSTKSTDVLYKSDSFYTNSRLDALRSAIKSFLDVVKEDDAKIPDGDGHHRVGLIKYASNVTESIGNDIYIEPIDNTPNNYTQVVDPLLDIASNISDISSDVDALYAGGRTQTGFGMQLAAEMMGVDLESDSVSSTDDRKKTIILFTDGEPTTGQYFMDKIANDAIGIANKVKAAGVEIYVVGLTSEATTKAVQFMEYCSSDYSDASSMDDDGSGKQFDKYFSLASTGEQLKNIFTTIASNEAKTVIGYDLTETGQVVLDALTDHFMLPENADAKNIGVYQREYLGLVNGVYTFKSKLDPLPTAKVSVEGREIIVSGFDFAKNWCGLWHRVSATGVISDTWRGKELVITIPIVVDPANPGGANNPTNEAYSGIYLDDGTGKPDMSKPVNKYPVPSLTMPNIVIKKDGLQGNDCAIFKIYALDESGNQKEGTMPFTVMLTAANNGKVSVKLLSEGRYKVVEDSWSWSYTVTPGSSYTKDDGKTTAGDNYVIRTVGKDTEDPDEKGTVFNFTNTKRTDSKVPAHGEDAVNNVFFTPQVIVH